ncbi:amidohydrolase [Paraclostridium sordellii]|uniref:Peptidase M20 domain-containing protein 2 n=1 Tax=Paraclostridium sordellii TaxID=1505 RepID=A0A0C7R0P8_PARSO|nr:amidohydrolase [Paeniclostridium sordellii]QYE98547.1 amidohydrolase [Paeniclostridium sordellii]CEN79595.1 amidohydrolase [[Clostridium] sordellii] [Paeniclostridium sordellii]CEQ02390.1 amidohydrolase [[Clostridium] sordellii] [Paeniclostridium sordellii]
MNKKELKRLVLEEIDKNKDKIIEAGRSIYKTPELGYKEVKSTKIASEFLKSLGVEVVDNIAVTGCMTSLNKDKDGPKIAVMGELDSVVCPDHKDANEIGNIHCCGHNIQVAGMLGCAVGIISSGVLKYLDGKIDFMAVPSEECIDLEFRKSLQEKNEIKYVGGKQELLYRGILDDVDMAMMFHALNFEENKNCVIKSYTNGFVSKHVTFIGRASHAGIAPHEGINALNMASLATNNINAQRETFKDEDRVRISTVINHGGDIVNVVPSKVTIEAMVRAATVEAMIDANEKVNRSLHAAAMALGGEVIIEDTIGYLPLDSDDSMDFIFKRNYVELVGGSEESIIDVIKTAGSTDFGDISQIIPCIHPWIGGVSGSLHTKDYYINDEELAYIIPAKAMAMTIIDLLVDDANVAKDIIEKFKPTFTKESYLDFMDKNTNTYKYDYKK